jgi:DNA primase
VAVVPAPHDPDSFIKANGSDAFGRLIEDADDFFDYYLKRLCQQHDAASDRGRLAVLRAMAEAVHKTGNAVLVDNHAQKTALRLAVSPDAVRAEFRKLAKAQPATPESAAESAESVAEPAPPPSPQEFWLLKLLLHHDEAAPWLAEHLQPDWLRHETVRAAVTACLAAHEHECWSGVAGLLDQFEDAAAQALISEAATDDRPIPHPAQQLLDVAVRLRNQYLDREMVACAHHAALPETPDLERVESLRRQQALREQKRAPLPPPLGLPD